MGRLCLSLSELPEDLPQNLPGDTVLEIRADALSVLDDEAITAFVHSADRDCILTWRSPEEGGGGGPRPKGLWAWALDWGFRWVDVELKDLRERSAEALAVPGHRRWVSCHHDGAVSSPGDIDALWGEIAAHSAWLRKLVLAPSGFSVNTLLREWMAQNPQGEPHAIFAQGVQGHVSRIWGGLAETAVLFCSLPERETAPGQPCLNAVLETYALNRFRGTPGLYGILGNPVLNSLSPRFHNRAFISAGLPSLYLPFSAEDPRAVVEWMRRGWCQGLSVTAPHKQAAAALLDHTTERVTRLGAANTLWMEEGAVHGDNTDYLAAVELLSGWQLGGDAPVAVLGTGGSARAVAAALEDLGVKSCIFGRNKAAGNTLAQEFGSVFGGSLQEVADTHPQAIVNTVPVDAGQILPRATRLESGILDLLYRGTGLESSWEVWARETGTAFVGGRKFLAHQGVHQFNRWTGLHMDVETFMRGPAE